MTTISTTAAVAAAIEELRATFPDSQVRAEGDGSDGAYVTVDPVPMGSAFTPSESWIGFHITFPYPEADVYPHFVTPDLRRKDGVAWTGADGFGLVQWGPRLEPATQLSRRSNRLNPAVDTAALKLLKVLSWLAKQ